MPKPADITTPKLANDQSKSRKARKLTSSKNQEHIQNTNSAKTKKKDNKIKKAHSDQEDIAAFKARYGVPIAQDRQEVRSKRAAATCVSIAGKPTVPSSKLGVDGSNTPSKTLSPPATTVYARDIDEIFVIEEETDVDNYPKKETVPYAARYTASTLAAENKAFNEFLRRAENANITTAQDEWQFVEGGTGLKGFERGENEEWDLLDDEAELRKQCV